MPIWSPDGTRVAFVSDRGGVLDIFLMELNGGEPERLTEDSGIWELSRNGMVTGRPIHRVWRDA